MRGSGASGYAGPDPQASPRASEFRSFGGIGFLIPNFESMLDALQ
jgi:hypothetical protein